MSWRSRITTPARHWWEDRAALRLARADRARYGIGYLNFWSSLPPVPQTWFYRFLRRPALRGKLPSEGITFLSVFGRRPTPPAGPAVFFTGEHLGRYPAYADHMLGEVDLALGFADLDHPDYLRFPLWITDLFPPGADLAIIQARLDAFSAAGRDLADRAGFAALIARHDRGGLRGRLADLVERHGPVTYAGDLRRNRPTALKSGYDAKLRFLADYKFNLCPENTDAPGYVTEKIWHALAAGCIPVYYGSENQPEPDILNPAAILFYDPTSPEDLTARLETIINAPSALAELRATSPFLPGAAQRIYTFYQDLEQQLLQRFQRP